MKGRVYVIKSKLTADIYFGSTIQTEYDRMRGHTTDYKAYVVTQKKYMTSFEIIKFGDAYMEMLEELEGDSKEELIAKLKAREGHFIQTVACVNKYVPGRTHKQWLEDNKEARALSRKKFQQEHKEELNARSKKNYQEHRETRLEAQKEYAAEHKEECRARCKKYNKDHKKELAASAVKYRKDHKEELTAYMLKYKENHKEELASKAKIYYQAKKAAKALKETSA